jgi:hypothetical protein
LYCQQQQQQPQQQQVPNLDDVEQENIRLEHELMALRQKVLMALKHASRLQAHGHAANNKELEAELVRVQVSGSPDRYANHGLRIRNYDETAVIDFSTQEDVLL